MKPLIPPKILFTIAAGLFFLLLGPFPARAISPPALVQTAATTVDTSAVSISQGFTSNNVAGDLIVVAASWGSGAATPTVTDSLGNAYTLVVNSFSSSGDQSLAIYYAKNVKAGANTVTVNLGGNRAWRRMILAEYNGVNTNVALDAFSINQGNASTATDNVTSGTATTTVPGDLIIGAIENYNVNGTALVGTGFTMRNSLKFGGLVETGIEDRIQAASGPISATFTLAHADGYIAGIAAFRPASSPDTTPPSVPTNLTAVAISASQINLAWSASTDNVAVVGYQVFRNSSLVATSSVPSYSDSGLTGSTAYTYAVAAFDAAGNVSAQSSTAIATTQPPPVAPVIATFAAAPSSIIVGQSSTLSWSVSGSPAPALSISPGVGTVAGTSIVVNPTVTTIYTLTATNVSGTRTAQSTVAVGPIPDTTPPSVPTNLTAVAISSSQINLAWSASTDNVAVVGYQVFRNSSLVATSSVPAYSDSGLAGSTAYNYAVAAFDAAGNVSAQSTTAAATTQPPPVAPVIATFAAAPSSIIVGQSSTLSWSVSGSPAPALSISPGVGTVTGTSIVVNPTVTTIYTLTATNVSGTRTAQSTVTVGPAPDTTPPSVPTNLTAAAISASQINLAWSASTDNVAVVGYQVYRNSSLVATSSMPAYSDSGLAGSTAYTYTVAAFDAAGNLSGQSAPSSATTQPPTTGPAYPIKLSADRTRLVDQNNQPFFIIGDSATSLIVQLSNADVDSYLADRAAKGINSIWVELIEHKYATNAPADVYGDQPFLTPGNFAAPNESYFQHADFVIREAARYGICVILSPAYVGYNCGSEGWCVEMQAASETVMTAWGRYVGNRYQSFPNILWLMGGDCNPTLYTGVQSRVNDVATGIKSVDTNHLMTAHNVRGESALDIWTGYSWLDLNDIYNLPQDIVSKAYYEYQRPDFLPFFLVEGWYEGTHGMTPLQLRIQGYESILSGAYLGYVFGNYAIWDFSTPGITTDPWQSQLNSEGSTEQSYLGAFFRSRETWKLVPDTNNLVMTAGSLSGTNLAVAARTSDGQTVIAYIPTQRSVTIDMTKVSDGSARVWWFNPQTASSTGLGTFPTLGSQSFTPPDTNDWLLVIDGASVNLPAPGTSVYSVTPPDSTPPSVPTNLTAVAISASQINLTWGASTDNIAVVGYQVFRNGSQIATSLLPVYSDTGLSPATLYTYAVAAFDAAGNDSARSASATTTTGLAADVTPPTVSITVPVSGATVNGTAVVIASATDPAVTGHQTSGVSNVQFFLDGVALGAGVTSSPYQIAWNTLTSGNLAHSISAVATDGAGNVGTATPITVTVDNQAPIGSVIIKATNGFAYSTAITLTLVATDNSGTVALMRFSNDGVAFSTPQPYSTNAAWTLAAGDGPKTVYAQFSDPVGNWSIVYTASITLDTTAPVINSTTATIVWTTDKPATSQIEYGTTLAYGAVTPLDPTLLTSHSVVLTGLVPQTVYYYRIHSKDAAGNEKISSSGQFMMVGSN